MLGSGSPVLIPLAFPASAQMPRPPIQRLFPCEEEHWPRPRGVLAQVRSSRAIGARRDLGAARRRRPCSNAGRAARCGSRNEATRLFVFARGGRPRHDPHLRRRPAGAEDRRGARRRLYPAQSQTAAIRGLIARPSCASQLSGTRPGGARRSGRRHRAAAGRLASRDRPWRPSGDDPDPARSAARQARLERLLTGGFFRSGVRR